MRRVLMIAGLAAAVPFYDAHGRLVYAPAQVCG
jgi:hypothetical protein